MESNMEVKLGSSAASATLVFKDEGHTLGNALRYMLIKDENVQFAGYTVPHPLMPEMHLRVATTGQRSAVDCTADSVSRVIDICDHFEKTFDAAYEDFRSN